MVAATVLAMTVLGTTGGMVLASERQTRTKLQERFQDRTNAGVTFVGVYMTEMLAREARLADLYLQGKVTPHRMELLTRSLDSSAAFVLDGDGAIITGFPHDASMVGTRVGEKYAHLRAALRGEPTVSSVVMSAVEGLPVVAAATPFDTPQGRRVFSAALSISGTPLAEYLQTLLPLDGASAHLFDNTGAEVIRGDHPHDGTIEATARAVQDVGPGSGIRTIEGEEYFFAAAAVEGAPWKIVGAVPTEALYAPFQASRWGAWVALGVLASFALALLYLFGRFMAGRQEFRYRALHCPLTGLANRRLLEEHANREFAKLARSDGSVALMYVDLDDFKTVNDTFGHDGGDQLLIQVAERLQSSLRAYDVAARIGGDEFAILLPDVSKEDAEELAARILFGLEQPFVLNGERTKVGSSIGVALTRSPMELDDLIGKADTAMYEAKGQGKGSYRIAPDGTEEPDLSLAI